jgi:hypothetical protein
MIVELVGGFLSGISITVLKDANGPFLGANNLIELIVAALIPPAKDWAAGFMRLSFEDIFVHVHL